jgi:hypothetical protein
MRMRFKRVGHLEHHSYRSPLSRRIRLAIVKTSEEFARFGFVSLRLQSPTNRIAGGTRVRGYRHELGNIAAIDQTGTMATRLVADLSRMHDFESGASATCLTVG